MSSFFINLKKISEYLSYAFIFISGLLIIFNIISMLPVSGLESAGEYIRASANLIFGIAAGGFIVFYYTKSAKSAIASVICLSASELVFYSLSGEYFSLLFVVLLAFLSAMLLEKMSLVAGYFSLLMCLLVLAVALGLAFGGFYELLKSFSLALKGKPSFFSVVNKAYSLLFSDNFQELFYHKGYSLTALVGDKLCSGAVDIFVADTENPHSCVADYLTSEYFVNIFVALGLLVALYSRFDGTQRAALVLVCLLSILNGEPRFMLVLVLLFNPFVYICSLFLVFVCSVVSRLLDIRAGFTHSASLFELFQYGDKWGYFIVTGVVISLLTYFAVILTLSKFDIQRKRYLPRDVRKIVSALGGERNIERIRNDVLYVKNPNLIDILRLDCDIHENAVVLHFDEIELLKQFF